MSNKNKKVSSLRGQFLNTQQTEAYRQLMATEQRILAPRNKSDIEKMKTKMEEKNNYFTMYKKSDLEASMAKTAQEHNKDTFYKTLPFHRDTVNEYDPKTKKDRTYAIHKAIEGANAKEVYEIPLTSSQEIGWREPIDNLNLGYGLKNSFEVFSSNFRENKRKDKEQKV